MTAPIDGATAAQAALQAYLIANITGLTVIDEWPYGNQKLAFPSVTITEIGVKELTPAMLSTIPGSVSEPDDDNQVTANLVTGYYDFKLQLDLWTRNKLERTQNLDAILALFDAQATDTSGKNNGTGIRMQLTAYFNEWASFEIESHQCIDDEAAVQRSERREKIVVRVNLRAIRQRTYYAMKTIVTKVQGSDQNSALTDDASNTDSNTVQ